MVVLALTSLSTAYLPTSAQANSNEHMAVTEPTQVRLRSDSGPSQARQQTGATAAHKKLLAALRQANANAVPATHSGGPETSLQDSKRKKKHNS